MCLQFWKLHDIVIDICIGIFHTYPGMQILFWLNKKCKYLSIIFLYSLLCIIKFIHFLLEFFFQLLPKKNISK